MKLKKKNKTILGLLSIVIAIFLFSPAKSEAQDSTSSSRVSYSFAEKSSIPEEHLRLLKEGFPTEIAKADEEKFILVYQMKETSPSSGTTVEMTDNSKETTSSEEATKLVGHLPNTSDSNTAPLVFMGVGLLVSVIYMALVNRKANRFIWLIVLSGVGLSAYYSLHISAQSSILKDVVVKYVPKGQSMVYKPESIEGYDYIGYIYFVPSLPVQPERVEITSEESRTSVTTTTSEPLTISSITTTSEEPSTSTTTIEEPTTSTSTTTIEEPTTSTSTATIEEPTTSTSTTTIEEPTTSTSTATIEESTASTSTTTIEEPTASTSTTTSEEPTTSTSTTTSEEPTTSTSTTTIEEPTTSTSTTTIEELTTSTSTTTSEEPTTSTSTTTIEELTTSTSTTTSEEPTTGTSTTTSEEPTTSTSTTTSEEPTTSTSTTTIEELTTSTSTTTSEEPTTSTSTTTSEEPTTSTTTTSEEPQIPSEEPKGKVRVNYYLLEIVNGEGGVLIGDDFVMPGFSMEMGYAPTMVAPPTLLEGKIGSGYEVLPLEIKGFTLYDSYNEVIRGEFKDELTEIDFYYSINKGSDYQEGYVAANFLLEDGTAFALKRYMAGLVGLPYDVPIPQLDNYQFIKIDGPATGYYSKEDIPEVSLTYKDIRNTSLTVLHLTEDGQELGREVIRGVAGKKYSLERVYPVYHYFYSFVGIEGGERTGRFTEEPQTVVYRYNYAFSEGVVKINYLNQKGDGIYLSGGEPTSVSGPFDTNYTIEPFQGNDYYELTHTEGDLTGTFDRKPREVNFYYRERGPAEVTVNYLTEDNQLLKSRTLKGKNGLPYSVDTAYSDGYELVRHEGELSGVYSSEQAKTVTLYYRELPEAGPVTVKFVDVVTNDILSTLTYSGYVGNQYTSWNSYNGSDIYELVEITGAPEKGYFIPEEQTITYHLKRKKHSLWVVHTSTDYFFQRNLRKSEKIEAITGGTYTITPIDNIEYVVDQVEGGNLSGEIPYGDNTVYVHYIKNPNRSGINFLYSNTMYVEFAAPTFVRGNIGETYTAPIKQFKGMLYVGSDSTDEAGNDFFIFKPEDQTITLFYDFKASVIVKHVYRNNPEYNTEVVLEGVVDSEYITEPILREGTIQAEIEGDATGYYPGYGEPPLVVTYYYD
ncbi:MucBP domain-containing protein [Streptococcus oriscaviae]|uniref:MucBP domain-containing protein n=1 Tax=Streptococcus oriscaviae TaxID=2781599 RepID=A0ABX7YL29_9STRE|nr:MucBP domain-containing protein [Streptococcus oriscaviae]QUE54291.1 MucBP domain-containing protein [Streptococcus oriscaviae]